MPTVNDYGDGGMTYTSVGSGQQAAPSGGTSSALLSGSQANQVGGIVGDFGNAVGDFMSIAGDNAAASSYDEAAALAGQNVNITEASTNVQEFQQQRQLQQTLGSQKAAVAANGFTNSGSALDIARASAEQGALAHSLIVSQGAINENAYRQQQNADLSMAAAEKSKAQGAMIGGITSTLQGVASIAMMA